LHSFLGPYTLDEGRNSGIDVGFEELLVDPEENRNDNARNAHHGFLLFCDKAGEGGRKKPQQLKMTVFLCLELRKQF